MLQQTSDSPHNPHSIMAHASAGLPSLNISINMSSDKKPINFLRGWPSPDVLPAALLSSAAQKLLVDPGVYTETLQYGPDAGYQPLREGLARWLTRHYRQDHEPDPERICVTGGASQNLACILQAFTDPAYTRAVWCAAPCYHLACPIIEDAGFKGRLRASPEDEDGVDLKVLEEKMQALEKDEEKLPSQEPFKGFPPSRKLYRHVIYVVTTSSNPSGKTWSLKRREGLVRLAHKYDALIISDDVYDFLQWPTSGDIPSEWPPEMRVPRVTDVDRAMGPAENDPEGFGHTVSNGSFSKIVGPGVRTGWAEASPSFIKGLSSIGATKSGGAPSHFTAAILSQLVEQGEVEKYIDISLRPSLQRRHKLMMDAIHDYITPLNSSKVQARETSLQGSEVYGGFFVWFDLDLGLPAKLIAETALVEENIIVGYGNMFEVHGDEESAKFDSQIRLCFAWEPEDVLVEGVKRLGDVLQRMLQNRDHYTGSRKGTSVQSFVDASK